LAYARAVDLLSGAFVSDIEFRDIRWQVLVADDSRAAATAVRRAIEVFKIGCDITEVRTGEACRDELASRRYHVAFVDVVFPDISGLDALEYARGVGIATFVTMMSGLRDEASVVRARALKAYDFIRKPFVSEDVIRVLDAYAHAGRRHRMLIVDASDAQRAIIRRIVGRGLFQFDLEEAADGVSGFETFVAHRPDVTLVDLTGERIDGRDFVRLARAHKPDCEVVPVGGDRQTMAAAGARRHLPKPFGERDVDDLMHDVLGLRRPFALA
jgi:CheY-like chemotaxis protein